MYIITYLLTYKINSIASNKSKKVITRKAWQLMLQNFFYYTQIILCSTYITYLAL